jgi:carboxyl-terminal processing protease
VLRINIIAEPTPQELLKAVEQLQQRGATHFALDLRDNGGGLLDSGIETVRLFLDEGTVIEQQYKNKSKQRLEVETPGPLVDIPLLVLVNQNTASAAEIIAGALQAHGRASLIGTHTFGKDTIQFVLELSDKSSLQVTTARWWIPGRESLSGLGFQADIPPLENTGSGTDACILAAIQTFFGKK